MAASIALAWSLVPPGVSVESPAQPNVPSGVACRNAAVSRVAPVDWEMVSRFGTGQPAMSTYGAKNDVPQRSPGTTAVSSLVMVPVAVAVPSVAPVGADSVTVRVSVGSTVVSPVTATLTCWESTPGAKVMVPDVAVKSAPAVAVPLAVA